jgi:23S rRNA (uracil-5-)-methyltransferase RumA
MPRRRHYGSKRTGTRSPFGEYPDPEALVTAGAPPWPCPHFPLCGGCQLQHLPYDAQITLKARYLSRLYGRDVSVEPAPSPFHYRARMDFVTTFEKIGLRRRGNFRKIVDITDCMLITPRALDVLRSARRLVAHFELPFFDINRREGFLKYITLRETRYGELMVVLYTNPGSETQHQNLERYAEALRSAEWIDSVWCVESTEISDRNQGTRIRHFGAPYIIEEICGLQFAVGPDTFFQNNTGVAEQCFGTILKEVRGERVLDLYCGVGSITLSLSTLVRDIIGVESVQESVAQAVDNAARNQRTNVRFIGRDVYDYLAAPDGRFDTVVLDPPRAGLGGKVVRRLLRLEVPRIVYMSCNPMTQADDIKRMEGYHLESLTGYDMFPQTEHVETVAVLVKQ